MDKQQAVKKQTNYNYSLDLFSTRRKDFWQLHTAQKVISLLDFWAMQFSLAQTSGTGVHSVMYMAPSGIESSDWQPYTRV